MGYICSNHNCENKQEWQSTAGHHRKMITGMGGRATVKERGREGSPLPSFLLDIPNRKVAPSLVRSTKHDRKLSANLFVIALGEDVLNFYRNESTTPRDFTRMRLPIQYTFDENVGICRCRFLQRILHQRHGSMPPNDSNCFAITLLHFIQATSNFSGYFCCASTSRLPGFL